MSCVQDTTYLVKCNTSDLKAYLSTLTRFLPLELLAAVYNLNIFIRRHMYVLWDLKR